MPDSMKDNEILVLKYQQQGISETAILTNFSMFACVRYQFIDKYFYTATKGGSQLSNDYPLLYHDKRVLKG